MKNSRKPIGYYLNIIYPITLYPEEAGGYTAEIKDLPGCISCAEDANEAVANILEAKEAWIMVAYEHGDEIPLPGGVK